MRRTLQTSYVLISTTLLFILLAVISVTLLFLFDRSIENVRSKTLMQVSGALVKQLEKRMYSRTSYLADLLVAPLYDKNYEAIGQILEPVLEGAEVLEAVVVDANGIIVHDGEFAQLEYEEVLSNREALDTLLKNRNPYVALGNERLVVARPIMIGQEVVGAIYIEITLDTLSEDINLVESAIFTIGKDAQANFAKVITYFTFLISFIAILTSVCIARVWVRPIKKLVAQAKEIGGGNYLVEKAIDRKDELGDLANAIREMGGKLQKHNQEISFMAYNDSLTNLPNRPSFVKTLNQEIVAHERRGAFLALLFIDLDGFKNINDSYGHHVGDELLIEVAARINSCLRDSDTLCRLGGYEFAVLLENVLSHADVERAASKIIRLVQKKMIVSDAQINISTSIGITLFNQGKISTKQLLIQADEAMYRAKLNGRNQVYFYREQDSETQLSSYKLERDFLAAVEKEALYLVYQPIIDLKTGVISNAEGLVRWQHSQHGSIGPNLFLPELERAGYLPELDLYVVKKAMSFLIEHNQNLASEFCLSINISGQGFSEPALLSLLKFYYQKHPALLHCLCLEITEQTIVDNVDDTQNSINAFHAMGIKIALDDFGTGYSSLSYINHFTFNLLKIDRSFMSSIEQGPNNTVILEAIIKLSKSLSIKTVAEGVETKEQFQFLKQLGCDKAQGFYMCKPILEQELMQLIQQKTKFS